MKTNAGKTWVAGVIVGFFTLTAARDVQAQVRGRAAGAAGGQTVGVLLPPLAPVRPAVRGTTMGAGSFNGRIYSAGAGWVPRIVPGGANSMRGGATMGAAAGVGGGQGSGGWMRTGHGVTGGETNIWPLLRQGGGFRAGAPKGAGGVIVR